MLERHFGGLVREAVRESIDLCHQKHKGISMSCQGLNLKPLSFEVQ